MTLGVKKFKIVNEGFVCENCGCEVPPTAQTTPRNHCPVCLWSKHVDLNPGDRANPCRGKMRPIGIYTDSRKEFVILHQCVICGERMKAKAILTDDNASDDFDVIMELSGKPIDEGISAPPHMKKRRRRKMNHA